MYWVVAQALGLAGWPVARFLFRSLPDRGYAFSKSLGLLLTGYLAWLIAMLGMAPFGVVLVGVCVLVVLAIGLLINRDALKAGRFPGALFAPLSWRMILAYETLFLVALVFLALLRSYEYQFVGPHPWGTERPMDFALFNAIRRSDIFPPHDPWLAGYSINYYYFGYLLMAVVAMLSGQAPAVAYNLSLALIFALTALGSAGIVYNLVELASRHTNDDDRAPRSSIARPAGVLAATLAVIIVLLAGNQGAALQVLTGSDMAVALDASDLARAVVNGLGPRQPLRLSREFNGDYFDGTNTITPGNQIKDFNWWNSSRALWDTYPDNGEKVRHYAITEFPFFSFWLGDMHPHVMALPFCLLALALGMATVARPTAPTFANGWRGWVELALTGVVLGSLYVINSWDFPTYVLLFLGALWLLYARLDRAESSLQPDSETDEDEPLPASRIWWRHYLTQAIPAIIAAGVLFIPFYLTFRSLVGAKSPLINIPILATITRTIGIVIWSHTPLHTFLIIFGLAFVPLLAYVLIEGRWVAQAERDGQHTPFAPSPYLAALIPAALVFGLLLDFPLLALLPLAIYAWQLALTRADHPAESFALGAFALGCLIGFGTEIVYIRDTFEGYSARMNTIFKFYYQIWVIWGVLAGYALWRLLAWRSIAGWLRVVIGGVCLVLLAGALVYPAITTSKAFKEGKFYGLAGKTPREHTPEGAASIAWLRIHVPAGSVILEATGQNGGEAYDPLGVGIGGVSAGSGLPTVLGWPGHEMQWRGGDQVILDSIEPRRQDVNTIYSTTDTGQARALLNKYNVDYIYVGAAERQIYPPEGLAKMEQLGTPVFQDGQVMIYQIKR